MWKGFGGNEGRGKFCIEVVGKFSYGNGEQGGIGEKL